MKYQSKKDPTVTAAFDFEDEKCKTTRLIYLTGDKAGNSFVVANSTLKRYWTPITDNPLNIDVEQVNKPYKPDVTPRYIPKPESVIEYEARKSKKFNADLPIFDVMADKFASNLSKINENSSYVKFKDGTTMWRKSACIDIYATESTWVKLTEGGFTSTPNKDTVRPFHIKISNADEFEKVVTILN